MFFDLARWLSLLDEHKKLKRHNKILIVITFVSFTKWLTNTVLWTHKIIYVPVCICF